MKNLVLTCILFCVALAVRSQFVLQPLNYPGMGYWPYYYSIVDPDHVWVGTFHEGDLPCAFSVKTTDGGDSWIFDPIPVTGVPQCVSICGWDANTCFFVFMDQSGPSLWKTANGGSSWASLTTTQFTDSFINFYHAFTADTGLAMGDPTNGYFEIQLTNDGGNSWSRVPSSDIPDMLPEEMGLNNSYSAVGNSIWFTTSRARFYRSINKGLTWDVGVIIPDTYSDFGVCFSTEQKGVIWDRAATTSQLFVSTDGGVTLQPASFPSGYYIIDMSRVPGLEGGFVVTAYKSSMRVYFTPDMFNTLFLIQSNILSNGAIEFYDESTGWLGGGESGNNEIYKYAGILTSIDEAIKMNNPLTVVPNPSSAEALVKYSTDGLLKATELRVTDMAGKVVYQYPIHSSGGWVKLNSNDFTNGIYLIEVLSGNKVIARERWLVNH